jgi:hypothetical protein
VDDQVEANLFQRLQHAGIVPDRTGWSIQPIDESRTRRVFFVLDPDGTPRFTARLGDSAPGAQAEALAELSGCAGVPELILADDADGLLVHRAVPGRPEPLAGRSSAQIDRLASVLACVHARRRPYYTIWPSAEPRHGTLANLYHERLAGLRRYLTPESGVPVSIAERLATTLDVLRRRPLDAASWRHAGFSRLHGDLSSGNVLWDGGRPWLIDWEYTRYGDPAEELAYLLDEHGLVGAIGGRTPAAEAILNAYGRASGDAGCLERIEHWVRFVAIDSSLWWTVHWQGKGVDPFTLEPLVARLDGALTLSE